MSGPATTTAPRWLGADFERTAFIVIALLTVARFAIAPFIPLAFDEAYYWRWSTHLALGYFDHPPLVAWMIRLGTLIAGDTEFGVRLGPLIGGVGASWAVWRAGVLLFDDRRLAATAAIYFNVMLIVSVGAILATPDAPLLIASAFLLWCLAAAAKTGGARWWLAAGIVTGIGCLAKYTALFWLPSIFLWLVLDKRMRPSLATPWPWLGAALAVLVFLPNLIWNATHDWLTLAKQFGRVTGEGFTPQYVLEHLGTEIGMATPVIFVLGWLGLAAFLSRRGGPQPARILLGALVWPTAAYFVYHSFHARVEGNWTGPIFPAFALAAAAALTVDWHGRVRAAVALLRPFAIPSGLLFVVAIYAQALLGWLPLGTWDPTASRIGAGMEAVSAQVEALRQREGATLIFTVDYPLTSWLSFYSPARPAPVAQLTETERWIQEPPLDEEALAGPFLVVLPDGVSTVPIEEAFGPTTLLDTITRVRGSLTIASYSVYFVRRRAFAALD